jgi:hypothetical protein
VGSSPTFGIFDGSKIDRPLFCDGEVLDLWRPYLARSPGMSR